MDILVQPNALPVSVQIADICCIKYSGEQAMPTEIYIEALDEELADVIEAAFLKRLIDGETQELAYTWLEVNHPCEQLGLTVELDSTSPNLRAGLFARSICG